MKKNTNKHALIYFSIVVLIIVLKYLIHYGKG